MTECLRYSYSLADPDYIRARSVTLIVKLSRRRMSIAVIPAGSVADAHQFNLNGCYPDECRQSALNKLSPGGDGATQPHAKGSLAQVGGPFALAFHGTATPS